jgi:gliding motility-associated-like protein
MSKAIHIKKLLFYILLTLLHTGIKAQFQVSVTTVLPTCYGYNDGEATATSTGGTGHVNYAWSNGQTGQYATVLKAGNYSVTATDGAGNKAIKAFTVSQLDPIVISTSLSSPCNGLTYTCQSYVKGGKPPYTYTWRNVETGQVTSSANLTNPTKGLYTLTVKDVYGCMSSITVTISDNFQVSIKSTDIACWDAANGTAEAIVMGGTAPYTYKWSNGKTTQKISTLSAGIYTVTVTDANGCEKSDIVKIKEPDKLRVNESVTGQCSGNAIAKVAPAGGTAPYTVKWSNGMTGTTATGLTSGTYAATVTDANGCVASVNIPVSTEGGANSITVTKANASCSGLSNGSAEAKPMGTGPFSYKWNTGATTAIITDLSAGIYRVTATNAAGCTTQAEVTIENLKNLVAIISTTNTNLNNATGSATVSSVTGGKAPYTYKWSNGQTAQTATNLAEGTYSVTVTDAEGCQVVVTGVVVKSNPNISLILTKIDASCSGVSNGSLNSTATGTAPYTYKWSNGATTKDLINIAAGFYSLTIMDAAGLTATSQATLTNSRNLGLDTGSSNADCNSNTGAAFVKNVIDGVGPFTYKWSNGQTTQTANNISVGTYSVTVTDAQGCQVIENGIVVKSNASNLSTSFTVTDESCGAKNGKIVFNTTGGTTPYTYKWNDNQTSQTASGLTAGSYSVTVTDANGCSISSNNIAVNASGIAISVSATKADASCSGLRNGSASATPTGTGAFTYIWSNGTTTQTISNLDAGTYKVTATSAAGCSAQAEVVVGYLKNISANIVTANTNFNSATGTATVTTASGGTPPYTYKWSNGQTGQTAIGLAEGTYSVTVTDAEGCQVIVTGVVVKSNPNISLILTKTDASCRDVSNGSILSTPTGTAPFTYKWSNGATTKDLINVAAGTYILTITDAAGLTATSQATVINSRTLSLNTGTTNADCSTNTGTASVSNISGGVEPYIYRWSNGQTTQTANNLGAGTYKVTVTDAQGCSVEGVDIIVNSNAPNITTAVVVTDEICNNKNGKIVFNTTGGAAPYTYKWSGGTNTDNLAAGDYTFTITDANKCVKIEKVTLKTQGGIKATFAATPIYNTADPATCTGDSVTTKLASASTIAGAIYKWSYPTNRTSTEVSPTVKLPIGTNAVQLTITSPEGCVDSVKTNIVSISPKIIVDVLDSALTCQGVSFLILSKNNNPGFPMTYKWSPDSLFVSATNIGNPSVLVKGSGSNKVYVTISNSVGCTKIDSVLLTTIPLDAVKLSDLSFKQNCNRTISFTDKSLYADKYTWKFGDPSNPNAGSSEANPIYTYGQSGTFQVTLIPKTGCLDTLKLTVPVRPSSATSVIANDTTVCNANPLQIKATSSIPNPKFEWSINPNFTPVFSTTNAINITPTNPKSTYYVRVVDSLGCVGMDTVVVNNGTLKLSIDTLINICKSLDKKISLTNNNLGDTLKIVWTPTSAIVGSNSGKEVIIKTTTDFTLGAQVSNQFGCSQTLSIPVKAREVDAKVAVDVNIVILDDKITLSSEPTGTGYTYQWTPASEVTDPKSAKTTAFPKQDTKYVVEITDQYGCKDTASVPVTVLTAKCSEPYVFVPRAFSPNNDGLNEKVYVRGEYLLEEGFEFAIYNRWGERVFFTKSREVGWDGTSGSKGVCPDVYGYYVKGKCRKGEVYFKKGNITVMK